MTSLHSILVAFYKAWTTERPARQAAALAYYGMFGLAPIVYVVLKVAGLFIDGSLLAQEFYTLVAQLLGADMAEYVRDLVIGTPQQGAGGSLLSTLISVGALLYAATGLFNHLRHALNTIWHADADVRGGVGGFVIGRLLSFLIVIGLGVLLVIAVFASIAISALRTFFGISSQIQFANILVILVLEFVTFAVIFKVLPDVTIGWRYIWIGSAVTTALITTGGGLVLVYLRFSSVGSAFDAAGSLAVLLIGIYYVAQIFLAGSLFTRVLASGSSGERE